MLIRIVDIVSGRIGIASIVPDRVCPATICGNFRKPFDGGASPS